MRYFFAVLIALWSFSASAEDNAIKIGISGPYSGELASVGDDIKIGVQLAVDDINAGGGVIGRKLSPLFEDDACDPKTGVVVANHFITEKVAMASAFCSKVCMAAAPVYAEENVPFLNECNTDEITNHGWSNVARTYVKNSQEAPKLAALIGQKARQHKLAVVYFAEEYNGGLAAKILDILHQSNHLTPDADYKLPETTTDFASIIAKLKDQKIDVVYAGLWPKAWGLMLRQAAAADYHPVWIGNLATSVEDVVKIAGPLANGVIFTNVPYPQYVASASSVAQELAAKNSANRPFAIYAYFLVQLYAEAVRKAGSTDTDKVMAALKSQKIPTLMGPVSFNANGDMLGLDFDYYQWQDGKPIPLKP